MVELIFYHSRLCMKCIRVRQILADLKKEYPNLNIRNVGALDKLLKRELKTIPAIEINNHLIYGSNITKELLLKELNL